MQTKPTKAEKKIKDIICPSQDCEHCKDQSSEWGKKQTFVECGWCENKKGGATLCHRCLHNRSSIWELQDRIKKLSSQSLEYRKHTEEARKMMIASANDYDYHEEHQMSRGIMLAVHILDEKILKEVNK